MVRYNNTNPVLQWLASAMLSCHTAQLQKFCSSSVEEESVGRSPTDEEGYYAITIHARESRTWLLECAALLAQTNIFQIDLSILHPAPLNPDHKQRETL
jgi:hypothetical protein